MTFRGFEVVHRTERFRSSIFAVVSDDVRMPNGEVVTRDYIHGHIGAVAIVAYDEATARIVLVHQYRHPLRRQLWELPAGLLDVNGEPPLATAQRELAEEADLTAQTWHTLVDLALSPGCSDELLRVYLARDLSPVPASDRHHRVAEEATMTVAWAPLTAAVSRIHAGEIENAACVAGVLAAASARANEWQNLRSPDAPWVRFPRGELPPS